MMILTHIRIACLLITVSLTLTQAESTLRRVCHFSSVARNLKGAGQFTADDVDPSLCTHIVFAFGKLDTKKGLLLYSDPKTDAKEMATLVKKKKGNKDVKLLLAVGGWDYKEGSDNWKQLAMQKKKLKVINSIISFLRDNSFDGLEIHWKYPTASDKSKFVSLILALRSAFNREAKKTGKSRLLLTVAVPAIQEIAKRYNVGHLNKNVDFINVMTYDFHDGTEKKTGFNSPLFPPVDDPKDTLNMESATKWWNEAGIAKDKINVGFPTFGHTFTTDKSNVTSVGDPATTGPEGPYTKIPGFMAYYEICYRINLNTTGFTTVHADQKVPFFVDDKLWISFDNIDSFQKKAQWVQESGYGGVMFWRMDLDDFSKSCETSVNKYPLIRSVIETFNKPLPSPPTTKALLHAFQAAPVPDWSGRRVCYFTSWSRWRRGLAKYTTSNVEAFLCTHIIYAYGTFDSNGTVKALDPRLDVNDYDALSAKKLQNKKLKVLLSIGGWALGSKPFSKMAANKTIRKEFTSSVIAFLRLYKFDGLDLHWVYPEQFGGIVEDKANFVILCKELLHAFKKNATAKLPRLLLTATVPGNHERSAKGFDVAKLNKFLDFISVMSYDYHGSTYSKTDFSNSLNKYHKINMNVSAKWWFDNGFPKRKINVGFNLHGLAFFMKERYDPRVHASASAGPKGEFTNERGIWAYYEICRAKLKDGISGFDTVHNMPYYVNEFVWVSYENERSLSLKAKWLKKEQYGGVMFWGLDLDDFGRACKITHRTYPLIKAVTEVLQGGTPAPTAKAEIKVSIDMSACKHNKKRKFADPYRCRHYYDCASGVPRSMVCPWPKLWDENNKKCASDLVAEKLHYCVLND